MRRPLVAGFAAAYGAFLVLYPRAVRRAYGRDMLATFTQQCEDAAARRGVWAAGWVFTQAMLDTLRNVWKERVGGGDPLRRPPRRRGDGVRRFRRAFLAHWWFTDFRYAFRLLSKTPVFTLMSIVVLGGGLGVSIFTFSFLYAVLFKPLPLADGEEIVKVFERGQSPMQLIDAADFSVLRSDLSTLSEIGAYIAVDAHLRLEGSGRTLYATASDWNLFDVARVPPLLGRTLRPDDQVVGAEPVAVLAFAPWQALFGADSAVVGRLVNVNGVFTRIVGVMPESFTFPLATNLWLPLANDVVESAVPGAAYLNVYARLASGATVERADAEVNALIESVWRSEERAALVDDDNVRNVTGGSVTTFQLAQIGPGGFLLFVILNTLAGFILLLACINVTNLLLARANERRKETAVRIALGAPNFRLIVQAMWETVIICIVGAALAVAVAGAALWTVDSWAQAHIKENLAFWWRWSADASTVWAAGAFAAAAVLVVGGVVAHRTTKGNFHAVLRDSAAGAGNREAGRLARGLVGLQVVVVSVIMFCGAVSAVTAYNVLQLDIFRERMNVTIARFVLDDDRYASHEARGALVGALHRDLVTRSAFDGVMVRTQLAAGDSDNGRFMIEGAEYYRADDQPRAYVSAVLGQPGPIGAELRRGRFFDDRDHGEGTPTAVVSEQLAFTYWPDGTAVGRRLRLTGVTRDDQWRTVVGVVSDVVEGNPLIGEGTSMSIYVPLRQVDVSAASVLVQHRGNDLEAQAILRQAMTDQDPRLVPDRVFSYAEMFSFFTMMTTATVKMFVGCFAFALVLAATGIYGLTARSVSQRTREVGVRRALGATDLRIVRLLMREGSRPLVAGLLITVPVFAMISVALSQILAVNVSVFLLSGGAVAGVVGSIVLAATYVPTRRAVALEPSRALWRE